MIEADGRNRAPTSLRQAIGKAFSTALQRQRLTAWATLVVACGAIILSSTRAPAQIEPPRHPAYAMTREAIAGRELIVRAARRFGEAGRRIRSIHYSLDGAAFNGLQGYDPADVDHPHETGRFLVTADFDYAHHQDRRRVLQTLPGGITLDTYSYYRDGNIVTRYAGTGRSSRRVGGEAEAIDALARYCPAVLAARALERLASATLIGTRIEDGRAVDVVEFSWDEHIRLRLHLGHDDSRIVSLETVDANPTAAAAVTIYSFSGERIRNGVPFPERVQVVRGNRLLFELNVVEAELNPEFPAHLLEAPGGDRPLEQIVATHALGNGVYEIAGLDEGAFRVVFFDLGDGVAIFDAPGSNAESALIADRIRLAVGDKPIRYLILSHFHNDHIAGVGYYVDRGVQIVTSRAAAPVIERVARAASRPSQGSAERSPNFLFVDGSGLELGHEPGQGLSVYRLPDCPHARDMLVAYAPQARLIVEADLAVDLAALSETSRYFSRWMAARGPPGIDWIVGTHLARIPRRDFDRAIHALPR